MVDQRERGLHAGEPLDHRCRGVVVERAARHDHAGQHAHDEPVEHRSQRSGVGAAHVAVAQRPGQRTERVDHLDDVGVVGGLRLDAGDDRLHDVGQVGEQGHVEHRDEIGQRLDRGGPLEQAVRRRGLRPWCREPTAR